MTSIRAIILATFEKFQLKKGLAATLSVIIGIWVIQTFFPAAALAQLEQGVMGISQNGQNVGKIYVPARRSKTQNYIEYWVLYPDYLYPGKEHPEVKTLIFPLDEEFASLATFQKAMTLSPGSHFIKVQAHELLTK